MKCMYIYSVSMSKAVLELSMPICLQVTYGCSHTAKAELSSRIAHRLENIY